MPHSSTIAVDFTRQINIPSIFSTQPSFSKRNSGKADFTLERYRHPGHDMPKHYFRQHIIGMVLQGETTVHRQIEGQANRCVFHPGSIVICPAEREHQCQWDRETEFSVLSIEPYALEQSLFGNGYLESVELVPTFHVIDAFLQQLGLTLLTELESGASNGSLYIESLFNVLAAHLLRHYSTHTLQSLESQSQRQARKIKQAIDYIRDRHQQDIRLTDIAKLLDTSPYQAMCLFKQSTGLTPLQYQTLSRVEAAQQLLKHTDLSIEKIATQVGFASQNALARHFRRITKQTPASYREEA